MVTGSTNIRLEVIEVICISHSRLVPLVPFGSTDVIGVELFCVNRSGMVCPRCDESNISIGVCA